MERPWWGEEGAAGDGGVDPDVRGRAFAYYIAHRLPQLETLDGQELTRSLRLKAARAFPVLEVSRECILSWILRLAY